MTPNPVPVLSDDALREIEERMSFDDDDPVGLDHWLDHARADERALVQTVRALRAEKEHWESPTDEGTCRFCGNLRDVQHGHIRKCYCIPTIKRYVEEVTELYQQLRLEQTTGAEFKRLSEDLVAQLQSTNTALREQLAEARRAVDHWSKLYGQVAADNTRLIDQRIKDVSWNPTTEEAEEYLRAHGIDPKDIVNGFIEQLLKERSELQSQLAQVTQERDALRDSASLVAFQSHQIDGQIAASLIERGAELQREADAQLVEEYHEYPSTNDYAIAVAIRANKSVTKEQP